MSGFYLETDRLILRDWREKDWAPFFQHTNTPAVMRWLGGVLDEGKKQWMRDRLEGYRRDHGFTFWVVERKDDGGHLAGELLGFCGLKRSNQEGGPMGEHEAGWRLREDAWGKGYAREAAEATLKAGFEQFGAPHIIALTVDENIGSWGLMKRMGMTRRKDLDFANDEFGAEEIIVYSITREEWTKTQETTL
ncbi:GNAT family N-acetyltransferase [Pontixanthobacter aquaemixtae]|uniref:GNAT family N-acetyltransferase n=1 Tax=Pontixanthobacter aquaemixtae TaxID=1958940 RepID=A0A845A159_9SPHN|nr:GNAT family N-acetyltransferase [Pontixanthobacter aquaemixtae]MXO91389.1 GNAT family N-acetyltransferase [Pontixanthobacter aquaemixtae]